MMWRLNFLCVALCFTLHSNYLLYYIVPLHVFSFLSCYLVLKIDKESNSEPFRLKLKLIFWAVFTFLIWDIPGIAYSVWGVLLSDTPAQGAASGIRYEWIFRCSLDHWSCILGAVFMVNFSQVVNWFKQVEGANLLQRIAIKVLCIGPLLIFTLLVLGPYVFVKSKLQYNSVHPYTVFLPISLFVLLRNCTAYLRSVYIKPLSDLGKITLETYLLQYHIWLSGFSRKLLVLIPDQRYLNLALVTLIFLLVSRRTFTLTSDLNTMLRASNFIEIRKHAKRFAVGLVVFVGISALFKYVKADQFILVLVVAVFSTYLCQRLITLDVSLWFTVVLSTSVLFFLISLLPWRVQDIHVYHLQAVEKVPGTKLPCSPILGLATLLFIFAKLALNDSFLYFNATYTFVSSNFRGIVVRNVVDPEVVELKSELVVTTPVL